LIACVRDVSLGAAFAGAVALGSITLALAGTPLRAAFAILATLALALIFSRHWDSPSLQSYYLQS